MLGIQLLLFFIGLYAEGMIINTHKTKLLVPSGHIAIFNNAQSTTFDHMSSVERFINHTSHTFHTTALSFLNNSDYMFIFYQQENRLEIFSPQYGLVGLAYKLLFCNWSATYTQFVDSCQCFNKTKIN